MILEQIAWVFKDVTYAKLKEFNKEVSQYQIDIEGSDDAWQPNEVVIDSPQVEIQYSAWIKKKRELQACERLSKDYKDLFEDGDIEDEDGEEVVILMTLEADNGKNFQAGELLLKINNLVANKNLGEYVFFEGLEEADSESQLPAFYMYLGN